MQASLRKSLLGTARAGSVGWRFWSRSTAIALTRRAVLAGAAALAAGPARAAAPDALYTATTIVTGYDMRSRPAGFARCLREVLVKLTGDPGLYEEPRIPPDAAPYVTGFSYFDPMAHRRPHDATG